MPSLYLKLRMVLTIKPDSKMSYWSQLLQSVAKILTSSRLHTKRVGLDFKLPMLLLKNLFQPVKLNLERSWSTLVNSRIWARFG